MRLVKYPACLILIVLLASSIVSCAKKTGTTTTKKPESTKTAGTVTKEQEQNFNLDISTYLSAREAFALAEAELKKLGRAYKLFTVVAASPVDSFMEKGGKANHWVFAFYFPGEPVVSGKTKTVNVSIDRRYKNKFKTGQGYYDDMIVDDKGNSYDIPDGWKDSPDIMGIIAKSGGDNFIKSNFTEAAFPSVNAFHCNYRIQASLAGSEWRILMNAGKSDDPNYLRYLKGIVDPISGKVILVSVNQ